MAASETVRALWVGPHEATTPDGQVLVPGETRVEISREEANASDYWRVSKPPETTSDSGSKS